MSSVIVKGMKMPKSCGKCWFNNSSLSCAITGSCIDRDDENRDRLDDCPIVALPDHHGRLGDLDALIHELNNSHYPGAPYVDAGISIAIGKVCDAPTIVEAEDSE